MTIAAIQLGKDDVLDGSYYGGRTDLVATGVTPGGAAVTDTHGAGQPPIFQPASPREFQPDLLKGGDFRSIFTQDMVVKSPLY